VSEGVDLAATLVRILFCTVDKFYKAQSYQAFVHHTFQTSEILHCAHHVRQWVSYDSYSIINADDFFISLHNGEPNYLVR